MQWRTLVIVESRVVVLSGSLGLLILRDSYDGLRPPLYAAFRFDQRLHRHFLSADPAIGQRRVRHGLVLFGGLSEGTCVRSRAETIASIAQNLEGGKEGARDRVVTGHQLQLP